MTTEGEEGAKLGHVARPLRDPRSPRWYWLILVPLLAVLTLPVVVFAAVPTLASVPAKPLVVPPMPVPERSALPSLRTLVDSVPVVSRNVSNAAGRAALHDYDTGHLLDRTAAAQMFHDAWASLVVPQNGGGLTGVNLLEQELIAGRAFQETNSTSISGPGATGQSLNATIQALTANPANASALNNAAVALFFVDLANNYERPLTILDGLPIASGCTQGSLGSSAQWLFTQASAAFQEDRALLLNSTALASTSTNTTNIQTLNAASSALPGDVTLRLALADAQAAAPNVSAQRATLQTLVSDPHTAPLGYAALGDSYLREAAGQVDRTSFTYRQRNRLALDEYDRALKTTTDPNVYAGRADALDRLGYVSLAIEAEQAAVRYSHGSPSFLDELSRLETEAGHVAAAQRDARHAFAIVTSGWDLSLADVRPVKLEAARAFDASYGSYVVPLERCGGGGGGVFFLDQVPKYDLSVVHDIYRAGTPQQRALSSVLSSDLLSIDSNAATTDLSRWQASLSSMPLPDNAQHLLQGIQLLAGRNTLPSSFNWVYAETMLRYVGEYEKAYTFCMRVATRSKTLYFNPADARKCAAESEYLSGAFHASSVGASVSKYRDSARVLLGVAGSLKSAEAANAARLEASQALEAAARLERAGGNTGQASLDDDQARQILSRAIATKPYDGSDVNARAKLGDIDFETGKLDAAIRDYTDAIGSATNTSGSTPLPDYLQAAYNNRGIAQLASAEPKPDTMPDCGPGGSVCEQALSDFRQALSGDPSNPIYLMNAGWAARLLEKTRASRTYLARATTDDPTLYPALNDLGVLAAEEGDTEQARHDFEEALAANPHYDLAAWNLGVLDLRGPVSDIPAGQSYLAMAIRENNLLRRSELAYKTDEHVYRYLLGLDTRSGLEVGRNLSVATVTLGAVSLLAGLYQGIRWLLGERAGHAVFERWEEHGPQRRWRPLRWLLQAEAEEESESKEEATEEAETAAIGIGTRWWRGLEMLIVLPFVLFAVTYLISRRESPETALSTTILVLVATAVALAAHEAGHLVAALAARARMEHTYWRAGVPLALLLAFVPVDISAGPYMGHRPDPALPPARAWWIAAGGPIANLVMTGVTFGLYLVQQVPVLRVMALAQLAVCAYSLLPLPPLDGKTLGHRPRQTFFITAVLVIFGMLAAGGVL